VKSGSGIARLELEEETTREIFETMWPLTGGRRVTKLRHRVPAGGLTWEIDEFTELGLVLAEIELPSVATSVEIPPWLAPYVTREVTGDRAYLNSTLAR
jgi:CYTH domain-containing protein